MYMYTCTYWITIALDETVFVFAIDIIVLQSIALVESVNVSSYNSMCYALVLITVFVQSCTDVMIRM